MVNSAVFVDRDNTINRDVPYCSRTEDFELLPKVPEGIKLLNQNGFKIVVITNQSGIARGYFTEKTLESIHHEMRRQLVEDGASIDAIYYCPHHPDDDCDCRKPKAAMLWQAVQEMGLDIGTSFVIGDSYKDIQMGKSAGCRTILVAKDDGDSAQSSEINPDYIAGDFYEAALWVVAQKDIVQNCG